MTRYREAATPFSSTDVQVTLTIPSLFASALTLGIAITFTIASPDSAVVGFSVVCFKASPVVNKKRPKLVCLKSKWICGYGKLDKVRSRPTTFRTVSEVKEFRML